MGESFTVLAADDVGDEERRRALERIFFHDILNTVGALKGLLQLLRETAPSGLSEDIGLIHAHFAALVEEIQAQRDLTAAEASELVPRMGTASSMQVLDEIKRRFDSSEAAEGRSIVIAEDSQDLVLETDFRLLARILGNMVKNGLEAVGPGETVTLHAGKQEGRVLFAVRNPGVIPPGVQVQIFRRSFSTKGPGRGLGTYGMKLLAERYLGGRVSFGSSPGTGTEFRVALPLASS
jgi:signal transduction histidine kinase